ncbi:uncharacterized protein LAESUDRAFT_692540 [Laetiporus sulphureus 93-53]|uniref:Uncharacterized protein n=1 Tax=Laetiporus sulphureus 93-53 TaxID=1314785 RepID=A0A165HCX7_9APHY|nr:uncharacterized protein LAESUDRAFT_692540 [Laetiporus sulphureus 93-53]KZT11564.1 hypothetical protein LAESUDRAFT_692540 [Laetiporus sulphureus 93-53]
MAGTKRAAEGEATGPTTRSAKAPKTEHTHSRSRKGGKKGPKVNIAASEFKARAAPLHVNFTHTPPVLPDAQGKEGVFDPSTDAGYIGTATLLPSTFATGSYGWKGSKRFTVELQNSEGEEKEKVHVMVTINATVMGSKGAKEEGGEEVAEEHVEGQSAEEHAEEKAENGTEAKEEAVHKEEAIQKAETEQVEADITEATEEHKEPIVEPEAAAAAA